MQADELLRRKTPASPVVPGGSAFSTHRLKQIDAQQLSFCASYGAKAFAAGFAVFGVVVMLTAFTIDDGVEQFIPVFIGSIFSVIGAVLFRKYRCRKLFDKRSGFYTEDNIKKVINRIPINEIQAIQVLAEECNSSSSTYSSYELNLVFEERLRINIIDHGNKTRLLEQAHSLASFLEVPLWNEIESTN